MTNRTVIQSLVGKAFTETQIDNSIAASIVVLSAIKGSTITENDSDDIDSAIILTSEIILYRGRVAKHGKITPNPRDIVPILELITDEIRNLIISDDPEIPTIITNDQPSTHWRV